MRPPEADVDERPGQEEGEAEVGGRPIQRKATRTASAAACASESSSKRSASRWVTPMKEAAASANTPRPTKNTDSGVGAAEAAGLSIPISTINAQEHGEVDETIRQPSAGGCRQGLGGSARLPNLGRSIRLSVERQSGGSSRGVGRRIRGDRRPTLEIRPSAEQRRARLGPPRAGVDHACAEQQDEQSPSGHAERDGEDVVDRSADFDARNSRRGSRRRSSGRRAQSPAADPPGELLVAGARLSTQPRSSSRPAVPGTPSLARLV